MKVNNRVIKTLQDAHNLLTSKSISCVDIMESIYANIDKHKGLNAYVNVKEKEDAFKEAEMAD